MAVRVTGTIYRGPDKEGDFVWMIRQERYAAALFVFNDNQEQFEAFLAGRPEGGYPGGGNAAIRPWQSGPKPRAAGIPTGSMGAGYRALDPAAQNAIDRALARIRRLLDSGDYPELVFSADELGTLGTGIFQVAPEVKDYITAQLRSLESA